MEGIISDGTGDPDRSKGRNGTVGAWIKKRWDGGKMLSELRPAVFLSLAACFMLFVFAPVEIYLGNQDEFWYDAYLLFPFLIKDFLFSLAVSLGGFALAYLLGKSFYVGALYVYFTCFAAFYIQGNYRVKGLPPFDGTEVRWEMYQSETLKDVVLWAVAAAVILALLFLLKSRKFMTLVSAAGIFFLLMLGSTLAVLGLSGGLLEQKEFAKFTKKDQFEMSADANFILLVLDAVDEACFWQVWERHPEYQEAMADFTFYNNAMSGYAYTDHSLPLMISGEWFENQEPYADYAMRIYRDSPFFRRLEEEGYSLSFYDDELQFEIGQMEGEFANLAHVKSTLWDPELFHGRLLKMTGIKYAPYFLKPFCWFDPNKLKHQQMGAKDEELFVWTNGAFYKDVLEDEISLVEGRRFKLIHLMGAHVPFKYDQYMNETEDADYFTCIESSMTVTMAYLDKLREAGVYDNSIILVLSDHGYNISGDAADTPQRDENQYGRQHPILFVKGFGERHEMKISGAPVSYEDLAGAYGRLLEGSLSDACFEYQEGDYRERRYLLYKYMDEDHMVEYVQTGYAGDEETLVPTGRTFDAR